MDHGVVEFDVVYCGGIYFSRGHTTCKIFDERDIDLVIKVPGKLPGIIRHVSEIRASPPGARSTRRCPASSRRFWVLPDEPALRRTTARGACAGMKFTFRARKVRRADSAWGRNSVWALHLLDHVRHITQASVRLPCKFTLEMVRRQSELQLHCSFVPTRFHQSLCALYRSTFGSLPGNMGIEVVRPRDSGQFSG